MQRKAACAIFMIASAMWSSSTQAINLEGTSFDRAAKRYKLDPLLVYSIALAESASGRGDGKVGPWQWTLRGPHGPFYGQNQQDTRAKFLEYRRLYGKNSTLESCKSICTGTAIGGVFLRGSP